MAKLTVKMANLSPERARELIAVWSLRRHGISQRRNRHQRQLPHCRLCVKRDSEGVPIRGAPRPSVDKSQWRGVAVVAELCGGALHPVSLELLGKARELAAKVQQEVPVLLIGSGCSGAAAELIRYGASRVCVYDDPALAEFRIEPYTAALEDFIRRNRPAVVLVGGTPVGRTLAPRAAARFRTGLTADCTVLDIKPNTDLEQIRPAFGGNIMAHINTPNHRPQFATVRYKIFPLPNPEEHPEGRIEAYSLPAEKLASPIRILHVTETLPERGIEEAEVIVAAGRGIRKIEDLELLRQLAEKLGGQLAGTRCVIEAGWLDHRRQIGLSWRTVAPKLIVCCGISGAVQFVAGMKGAERIVAINADPDASIFNVAHVAVVGDLYEVVPRLLKRIEAGETL